jgi:hypothetical protein
MAAMHAFAAPRLVPLLISLSSMLALLGVTWIAAKLVYEIGGRPWAQVVAAGLTATAYPLVFWSLRGMEVGVVALTTTTALWLAVRYTNRSEGRTFALMLVVVFCAPLVRTDALLLVVPAMGLVVWKEVGARRWTHAVVVVIAPAASVISHTFFRIGYYGEPFPNTYYLKVEGVELAERLGRGLAATSVTTVPSWVSHYSSSSWR